jgi:hypothetical protein
MHSVNKSYFAGLVFLRVIYWNPCAFISKLDWVQDATASEQYSPRKTSLPLPRYPHHRQKMKPYPTRVDEAELRQRRDRHSKPHEKEIIMSRG